MAMAGTAPGMAARPLTSLPTGAGGPLVRITYEQPPGSGRLVRALVTRIGSDDASGRNIYADMFGTTLGLARDEVLEETSAQPFIGLVAYSTDPALPGVAHGYAVAGGSSMPTTDALVPYDVLWNLWGGSEHPADASLPPPLAAAAEHIENSGDLGNIVLTPSIFPLGAAIILAPAARDAQEALDAYARAVAGLQGPQSSPIEQVLDRAFMLADGQMLVIPPQLWAPARVPRPVAFVVRRLFGYVRRAPYAPGAYEVARVPVITVGGSRQGSFYALDIEPAEVPTPATSHDALAAYYAAGPGGRPRSESPAGDAAEAAAIETALRAQSQGGLAVGLTGALPPTLAVIMASREAPTPRERAHWSQFMRRVARAAGGTLPEPPRTVPPRALVGLHVAPFAATTAPPSIGSLSATALAIDPSKIGRRVFRYDTTRGVWHDVSLVRPALPSLTDRELEDLLLALPETPDSPRAPLMTFYLVGPDGPIATAGNLARTVTFAPEAINAADRQEGRRRAEAQRAQVQSRARFVPPQPPRPVRPNNQPTQWQQQQQQQQPTTQPTGSVLGRRRQPPTPTPPSPTPLRPTCPTGPGTAGCHKFGATAGIARAPRRGRSRRRAGRARARHPPKRRVAGGRRRQRRRRQCAGNASGRPAHHRPGGAVRVGRCRQCRLRVYRRRTRDHRRGGRPHGTRPALDARRRRTRDATARAGRRRRGLRSGGAHALGRPRQQRLGRAPQPGLLCPRASQRPTATKPLTAPKKNLEKSK
ncbi:hypothetical protein TW95_gp1157 [Pandoravirus inopinatum]|uniref:Uncharacterized protein n=1 Tax=Pandoravirus inopinatum TaxID=1605721 RepID=A0A0B5JAE4_9VIRU|nr:hypothetical protein TW95_gp1157 [Pandoravirus inopinatum]AJF97891.1 hypothetical protein [Pandoravirus inopinatum]